MEKKFVAEGGIEVTDDLLDQLAEPWERGEVPGEAAGFVRAPGQPRDPHIAANVGEVLGF